MKLTQPIFKKRFILSKNNIWIKIFTFYIYKDFINNSEHQFKTSIKLSLNASIFIHYHNTQRKLLEFSFIFPH